MEDQNLLSLHQGTLQVLQVNCLSNQSTSVGLLLSWACLTVMQKSLRAIFLAYLCWDTVYEIVVLVYIHFYNNKRLKMSFFH